MKTTTLLILLNLLTFSAHARVKDSLLRNIAIDLKQFAEVQLNIKTTCDPSYYGGSEVLRVLFSSENKEQVSLEFSWDFAFGSGEHPYLVKSDCQINGNDYECNSGGKQLTVTTNKDGTRTLSIYSSEAEKKELINPITTSIPRLYDVAPTPCLGDDNFKL